MQDGAPNHTHEHPPTTSRLTEARRDQAPSQRLGDASRDARPPGQRHTVKEAAEFLGTTIDAVRGRIRRGTLDSVRLDGVVYVLLDATNREQHSNQSEPAGGDAHQQTAGQSGLAADQSELVGELRGQIDWLRREVERKDTIIMSLTQRIPELEAPRGPQGATEESSEVSNEGEAFPEQQEPARRRSWWRRFFGIE
jgi:hypothetical protein